MSGSRSKNYYEGGSGTTSTSTSSGNGSGEKRKGRDPKDMAADTVRHNAAVAAVAIYLRFLWRANPDVHVETEYRIPGAQPKNAKADYGRADIVVIFPDYIYVWEVKSAIKAEEKGPGDLDRYINALRKIERKEGTFRTVERGNNLPQITTLDPLDPKKQLVAESTQQRKGSPRTSEEYKGVIGWWTRSMPKCGKGPDGYERETVPVLEKIQVWQPTPEQQRDIALGAATSMAIYVIGKMFTSPFGLG